MNKLDSTPIIQTKTWIANFVVGMNFCPFAKIPFEQEQIRYQLFEGDNFEQLAALLIDEMNYLLATTADEVETTLIVCTKLLEDFSIYLDFLAVANQTLEKLRLDGILQIASFHPNYQFAGTSPKDVENYTNRSPFPMLHLLREDSVTRAIESGIDTDTIPTRNIAHLQLLGLENVKARWNEITRTDR